MAALMLVLDSSLKKGALVLCDGEKWEEMGVGTSSLMCEPQI